MAETKAKPGVDKVWTKKMHSTWHQKWVPDLVPRSGYQIWRPEVGTRFGAKKWVPNLALNMEYNLEQRGDQKWVPNLAPRSRYQIVPRTGDQIYHKTKAQHCAGSNTGTHCGWKNRRQWTTSPHQFETKTPSGIAAKQALATMRTAIRLTGKLAIKREALMGRIMFFNLVLRVEDAKGSLHTFCL